MAFGATNEAALDGVRPLVCWFAELVLTGVTLRLLSGVIADITFSSKTFVASHATYGTLASIGELVDGSGAESARPEITVNPPSDAAAIALMEACDDGSVVNIWFGILDRDSGQPVAAPELMFAGYADMANLAAGDNLSAVTFECITAGEYFHDSGEGYALNGSSHKLIRPGETGFDLIGLVDKPRYWGGAMPSAVNASGTVTTVKPTLGNIGTYLRRYGGGV